MNPSDKDRLLREILADDGQLAEFRRASLALGLETVRGKRRRRRALQAGFAAALFMALAAAFGISFLHRPAPPPHQITSLPAPPRPQTAAVSPTPATREVKIISDKELFALFPDRPLALIGKPGQQRLVFLDAGRTSGHSPAKTPGSRLSE